MFIKENVILSSLKLLGGRIKFVVFFGIKDDRLNDMFVV